MPDSDIQGQPIQYTKIIPAGQSLIGRSPPAPDELDFVGFLSLLKGLVPCPADRAKRAEWMAAAEQLWELSR